MKFSKRAKAGIRTFSKIQWSLRNAKYHLGPKNLIKLDAMIQADPRMVAAANEAMEILKENGRKANANIQVVSNEGQYTITPDTESGSQQRISVQPKVDQTVEERGA